MVSPFSTPWLVLGTATMALLLTSCSSAPSCITGWEFDTNGQCQPIDECARNLDDCGPNATCSDLTPQSDGDPGYRCSCGATFEGDGGVCTAIDAGYDAGTDAGPQIPAPRLISPMSTAILATRRPVVTWVNGIGADGAEVEFCRDRLCTNVIQAVRVQGTSATPSNDVPTGKMFWRARGSLGAILGTAYSPVWQVTLSGTASARGVQMGIVPDFDGDGFSELAVGAPKASVVAPERGHVVVYGGGAGGVTAASARTNLPPPAAVVGGGWWGFSVAAAGDVDGDGFGDLLVGAPMAEGEKGRVVIFLGGPTGLSSTRFIDLAPPAVLGGQAGKWGWSVAGAGDGDGDGFGDILVGAPAAYGGSGAAYLLRGQPGGPRVDGAEREFTTVAGIGTGANWGHSVTGGCDFDGNGFADVVIGAPIALGGAGYVLLYYGAPSGPRPTGGAEAFPLPSYLVSGPGNEARWGSMVSCAGDVNGGGDADLVISAGLVNGRAGTAVLYYGGIGTGPNPNGGAAQLAAPAPGEFGYVVPLGDVDRDGLDDLLVGAEATNSYEGAAYVYLFRTTIPPDMISPTLFPTPVTPTQAARWGRSASGARDGSGDIFIAAPIADAESGRLCRYSGGGGAGPSPTACVPLPPPAEVGTGAWWGQGLTR